jgi:hypothetical protein
MTRTVRLLSAETTTTTLNLSLPDSMSRRRTDRPAGTGVVGGCLLQRRLGIPGIR